MTTSWIEHAARAFEPAATPRWATPGDLARHLDPRTVQTPALDLIDQALVRAATTPDARLIISMPPQEGKSQRASRRFPLWVLTQRPDTRVAIASYQDGVARRWGRAIRDDITTHGPTLGLRVRDDLSAQHEWQLAACATCTPPGVEIPEDGHRGHDGGVYTTGIGGALTGRPVDLLIIDDPVKGRKDADSQVMRDDAWDWWTDTASTRLAPGAPVVLILTRWHEDDLAGRLLAAEDGHLWDVINIPAQADHRPDDGETDPLDREVGEFMRSARGRTIAQWAAIRVRSGARTWASLYQGRPSPEAGDLFHRDQWQRYDQPLWVVRDDGARIVPGLERENAELIQSWDMTFKDTAGTDFVVGQVWLRRGADCYLLDQTRDRLSFTATCQAFRALSARWPQAVLKLVEDKANGPAVISALGRTVAGIVPEEPHGSKYARASAVSPLIEAGNVHLPASEVAPWADDLIEEAAAFPNGAHDDQVDALSQALTRLVLRPLLAGGDIFDADDVMPDDADDMGYLSGAFG